MSGKLFGFGTLFTIILLLSSSWILIHALAIFGMFLAISYPLLWLFAPNQVPCLLCRAKADNAYCPFCRKTIDRKMGVSPNSLLSAILNGGLIVCFAMVSLGVVFVEGQVLYRLGFPSTPKTASFVIPSRGQYRLGEIFPMKVEIDNVGSPINAVQADIGFNSKKIEVVDISTADSFANVFIQKEINNEGGWARLTGGLPNPGFLGDHGTFGTVYFKGKTPGLVKIGFLSSSMALANDGKGTNILKDLPSVSYFILPDRITPEEEKEQQNLISASNVLGSANDQEGQLIFYEEESVLGKQTLNIEKQALENESGLLTFVFSKLGTIDSFIISFWGNLVGAVL